MLYLPPGVAHNGIALDPCMTVSIGFLSPSRNELITGFIDDTVSAASRDTRFTDPDRRLQKHAGEISKVDLNRITGMKRSTFADDALLEEWPGRYITRDHDGREPVSNAELDEKAFRKIFSEKKAIHRSNGVRAAFIRQKERQQGRLLFSLM